MNDRPDLAAELDCDGAHVGEEDAPYEEARRLLGPDRIVGVTCGDSRHRALVAAEPGPTMSPSAHFFRAPRSSRRNTAPPPLYCVTGPKPRSCRAARLAALQREIASRLSKPVPIFWRW